MKSDYDKYLQCMEEIKLRQIAITEILKKEKSTSFKMTNIEFICLQFRKILELIAMASLAANKEQYENVYNKFYKHWNAKRILKDIKGINPHFYPVPTKQKVKDGVVIATEDVKDGYLTQDDFADVYNDCSEMIHAKNPYDRKTIDYEKLGQKFVEWNSKICTLLEHHQVQLYQSDLQLWVGMKSESDGKAFYAVMQKIK